MLLRKGCCILGRGGPGRVPGLSSHSITHLSDLYLLFCPSSIYMHIHAYTYAIVHAYICYCPYIYIILSYTIYQWLCRIIIEGGAKLIYNTHQNIQNQPSTPTQTMLNSTKTDDRTKHKYPHPSSKHIFSNTFIIK